MAEIAIDTSGLTFPFFSIPEAGGGFVDGSAPDTPPFSLPPGRGYHFNQATGAPASFQFDVLDDGTIDFDRSFDRFLRGRGDRKLTVAGLDVELDGQALDHGLTPQIVKGRALKPDQSHRLKLVPTARYRLLIATGLAGHVGFELTPEGNVVLDPQFAGIGSVQGNKLTVTGHTIRIDGTALVHDLLPMSLVGYTKGFLSHQKVNELTVVPGGPFRFQSGGGIVANFQFNVAPNGSVVVEERFRSFAEASGNLVTIRGHTVRIDGRSLDHDLLPISLFGRPNDFLPRASVNELRVIPAAGYRFQPGGGVVSDLNYEVGLDGGVVLDPSFASFAAAAGNLLTIMGHTIKIDGRALSHDLLPISLFGRQPEFLSRTGVHELTVIPAAGYKFQPGGGVVAEMSYQVRLNGTVDYPPSCDPYVSGRGSDTLVLLGYPLLVDATDADSDLVSFVGAQMRFAPTRRLFAVWLPAKGYLPQTRKGVFTNRFNLEQDGRVTFDPALEGRYVAVTSSSPNPSRPGQEVAFMAVVRPVAPAVGTPTGGVVASEGEMTLGRADLDGTGRATIAVSSLGLGDHQVLLAYEGDDRFDPSSATVRHRVEAAT